MRGPEEVSKMVQQAQQAQAQAQQQEATERGVQTASVGADVANTLSNTEIGAGQNALGALLGQ